MSAAPTLSFAATMTVNDNGGSPAAFAFPIEFTLPGGSVGKEEYSYMGQSAKGKHFGPSSLHDNGDFEFSIFLIKADYTRLVALKGVTKTWVMTLPDDGTGTPNHYTMSGFLSDFSTPMAIEGYMKTKCKVTIDGDIT